MSHALMKHHSIMFTSYQRIDETSSHDVSHPYSYVTHTDGSIIPSCFTSLQSCYTHWWKHHPIMLHNFTVMLNTDGSIIPSCSQSLQPCHMHWWSTIPLCYSSYQRIDEASSHHVILPTKGLKKHHPIMLFFLPKDWRSTIPSCYSSYQRIDEASSHYVILPTKGLMKHHPIMLHILTAISCTLMKQIRSCFTSLQPCHTHWWMHPPLMLTHIPYSHFIPYGGASYHHVHTLTATSHPTVEPPTIMLTHLQPHHTQLWSLLPSCSHTYSHVTPNCGTSYHHVHTLTAMSHPTIEHFYPSHTYSFHTLICTLIPTLTFMSHSMMETAFPGLVSSTNSS